MRDILYNEDDPGLITKKFLSQVKSNSKPSRLPETMHLDDTFCNIPSEKAVGQMIKHLISIQSKQSP